MQGLYSLVKFCLVVIYILKIYRKNILFDFIEKKNVQFLNCVFLFKSMYFSSFERFLCWKSRNCSVWFAFYPYFFAFFCFFFFLSVFSVKDTNVSQNSSEWRGNHYFSCFPRPSAHEYPFSFSRLLPLLFNWSICNYQTDNWWGLLISIFIDAVKSDLTFIFQCDIVRIWSHIKLSLFYYKVNGLTNRQ